MPRVPYIFPGSNFVFEDKHSSKFNIKIKSKPTHSNCPGFAKFGVDVISQVSILLYLPHSGN